MNACEQILKSLRREVWIVTSAANGKRGGLLATWVSAASLDPEKPVMLAGIAPNHYTCDLIRASGHFRLHLLRKEQIDLAWSFASGSGRERDKLAGLALVNRDSPAPLLPDCLAWLDCHVVTEYAAGDRIFFWADVLASELVASGSPLTDAEFLAALSPEQRQRLLADRHADILLQRPLQAQWRENLPG